MLLSDWRVMIDCKVSWVLPIFLACLFLTIIPIGWLVERVDGHKVDSPLLTLVFLMPVLLWAIAYTWNARISLSENELIVRDGFMRKHVISPRTHKLSGIEGPDVPFLRTRGNKFIYFFPNGNSNKRLKVNLAIQKPESQKAIMSWIEKKFSVHS